jgi:hypothetical protein
MKRSLQMLVAIAVALGLVSSVALADHKYGRQVRFAGIHPIPKVEGGGMCYIEGPHVHIYAANKLEYREHGPDHVFVGDPVAYNYDGQKYAYKGPHPIHVDAVVGGDPATEYCYIEGPHYHYFAPPEGPDFKVVGDAYFYVGEPPHVFIEARPTYVGINAYYRPFEYRRPVVEVEAPVGWIGARAEFVTPGAVIVDHRGREVVGGPGVGVSVGAEVHIPMPSVHVGIDIGGPPAVIVHDRPAPVIIERDHREHEERDHREHEHHDNGRHEGWNKGHR